MTRKERIKASLEEMEQFGETFIGTMEVQGMAAVRYYNALRKKAEEELDKTVCWDIETGMAWLI